ncbi:MAG: dihydrofolate reductase family protein [Gaiellaceae bacterium]
MGRIVVSENVSLDGVMGDPTGEEGSTHGGWFQQFLNGDGEAWSEFCLEQARGGTAILLGRRSDEYFGSRWNSREGEWADRLNGLPKYVISSTLEEPVWINSTVLKGDVVSDVSKLKQQLDGEILCFASRQLARTLLKHGLVDEVRLIVYPAVLGVGERLFDETSDKTSLRRLESRTIGGGLAYLSYEVSRAA